MQSRLLRRAMVVGILTAIVVLCFSMVAFAGTMRSSDQRASRPKAGCLDCHSQHSPNASNCSRCHTLEGVDYHRAFNSAHTFSAMNQGCQGAGCHTFELVDVHSPYVGAAGRYPQYSDTCALCHLNQDPARIDPDSTSDCSSCHQSRNHEPLHVVTLTDDCAGCHIGSSLTLVHLSTGCAGCHQSVEPEVMAAIASGQRACEACHAERPHADLGARHEGAATVGPMSVFDNHEGGTVTRDVPCTLCHASMNLLSEHGGSCATCHNGSRPADSFETWGRGCQQGACHTDMDHPSADSAHNALDCMAACHENDWSVSYSSCDGCHTPSGAAPTTISNVKANYVGSAAIAMNATGITWTHYRLDGGPRTSGTVVTVPAPPTGTASHSLEYWSVDDAGNEEQPHQSATFTVMADVVPPVTASSVRPSYIGPALITFGVTDDNSSGARGTYWRLDGAAQAEGASIFVAQPDGGQQEHALEFWSVDASGNEELPHQTVVFTIVADIEPPTGSVVINGGSAYTVSRSVSLSLSADDADGSGVAQMRISTDTVNWSAWQPYATERSIAVSADNGPKTVWVQFSDAAGNVTTCSDGIVLDNVGPAGSLVINDGAASAVGAIVSLTASATDGLSGSGLSQMQVSNDNANWSTWEEFAESKSWTLSAGGGMKTVYIRYRDAAGNVSPTYADTIVLDAPLGATLSFAWHPDGWAQAHLRVEDASGQQIVDTWVSGSGSSLDLNVAVQSGQIYYMECVYYYDEWTEYEGGPYGKWTNDTSINTDGVVSPGETVVWNY